MSDFDTVGKELHSDAASEALDRIEARLSTAEEALREIGNQVRAPKHANERLVAISAMTRNALQPEGADR